MVYEPQIMQNISGGPCGKILKD